MVKSGKEFSHGLCPPKAKKKERKLYSLMKRHPLGSSLQKGKQLRPGKGEIWYDITGCYTSASSLSRERGQSPWRIKGFIGILQTT